MIAPLGETTVGAVGLCAQFTSLMFSGYWGFVGGGMLFFAQYWGAKDDDGIERSYGLTLTCMMCVAAVFTETHENPDKALSDGPNTIALKDMKGVLEVLKQFDEVRKRLDIF